MQELEDILDDDQDMEDMYLGRRRGEEAVDALQQMAQLAQLHTDGSQADDASDHSDQVTIVSPLACTVMLLVANAITRQSYTSQRCALV